MLDYNLIDNHDKKKILVIHNIFPVYIKGFWDKLIFSNDFTFDFYFSSKGINGIKSCDVNSYDKTYHRKFNFIKNYLINGILFWQTDIIKASLVRKYDGIIFLGEANIISTWISAIIGRIRGKKVIFRGHGMYGNEKGLKLILRILFYKIPSINLVYSEASKKIMIDKGISDEKIHVIYNSLNFNYQKDLFYKLENKVLKKTWSFFNNNNPVIFFLGRLTGEKKIELLIRALSELNSKNLKVNLLIIGNGEQYENLNKLSKELLDSGQYYFTGEVYDEIKLANYIYHSDLCISPGNVGLTAVHSLSYGTPVATHNNSLLQGPEHEIIKDFVNGFYFTENSVNSIVENTIKWFKHNHLILSKNTLREPIDLKYNPNYQYNLIKQILNN